MSAVEMAPKYCLLVVCCVDVIEINRLFKYVDPLDARVTLAVSLS